MQMRLAPDFITFNAVLRSCEKQVHVLADMWISLTVFVRCSWLVALSDHVGPLVVHCNSTGVSGGNFTLPFEHVSMGMGFCFLSFGTSQTPTEEAPRKPARTSHS